MAAQVSAVSSSVSVAVAKPHPLAGQSPQHSSQTAAPAGGVADPPAAALIPIVATRSDCAARGQVQLHGSLEKTEDPHGLFGGGQARFCGRTAASSGL